MAFLGFNSLCLVQHIRCLSNYHHQAPKHAGKNPKCLAFVQDICGRAKPAHPLNQHPGHLCGQRLDLPHEDIPLRELTPAALLTHVTSPVTHNTLCCCHVRLDTLLYPCRSRGTCKSVLCTTASFLLMKLEQDTIGMTQLASIMCKCHFLIGEDHPLGAKPCCC